MNKVELQNLVGGQLQEKFERAFESVIENLQDPNTSFKVKRGITIKLSFTQNENRDDVSVSAQVVEKLAPQQDMNTKFYRDMDEAQSLRDSRPVKEVWAVFPREVPGSSDEDYSLRFIPLSPGSESRLPQLLEDYLRSLGLRGD